VLVALYPFCGGIGKARISASDACAQQLAIDERRRATLNIRADFMCGLPPGLLSAIG
jgi:hypothetical protein